MKLKASAAKNKSIKYNYPCVVDNSTDLEVFIRNACTKGKFSLKIEVKNNDPKKRSVLTQVLRKKGYKVKTLKNITDISWV